MASISSVPPVAAGSGLPPGLPPLPPTFPPGVDPTTYKIEEVTRLLKAAAYFPIFNVPNPSQPNQPVPLIPGIPQLMIAVEVNEALHHFEVVVEAPTTERGLRAVNRVSRDPVARVHIRWTPIPEDFDPAPGLLPPPTILNPFQSQRFTMLDGELDFLDGKGSGFHAFGAGRTFPAAVGGKQELRIGAVIDVLQGLGELSGLQITAVINGFIEPPDNLALNLMVRVMDPDGRLRAHGPLPPVVPMADPDPSAVFFFFLGEPDPDKPVELILGPNGLPIGSRVFERLRLVRFDIAVGNGLHAKTAEGPVVGSVSAQLFFNFLDPRPVFPIQTTQGVFTFHDRGGAVLGTVLADMVEGRALRTELAGAPMPVFRFGGFGPITGGTDALSGVGGMMTMNSAISVFPRTLSNLYILRLEDPDGRFRARLGGAIA